MKLLSCDVRKAATAPISAGSAMRCSGFIEAKTFMPSSPSAFFASSVAVGQVGDRALHRAGVWPQLDCSGIERFLAAAKDKDERALLDEALCRGAADAGGATGDHRRLSIQSVHVRPVGPKLAIA